MLRRRSWIKAVTAVFTGAGLGSLGLDGLYLPGSVSAQEGFGNNFANSIDNTNLAKLEDQLRYGLRCVTPAQIAYVGIVANAVEQDRIPRAMVNLVYRWSLERNPRVPFPYFQFAIRELAKRRGVSL